MENQIEGRIHESMNQIKKIKKKSRRNQEEINGKSRNQEEINENQEKEFINPMENQIKNQSRRNQEEVKKKDFSLKRHYNGEFRLALEEEVKSNKYIIYICVTDRKSNDVCLYKIDANKTSVNNIPTSPLCTLPGSEIGSCYGKARLGSKIYIMGGCFFRDSRYQPQGSSFIFSFDTSSTPIQWKKESTEMLAKRGFPAVEAAHGKIYIFGSNLPMPNPWAEVYDPKLNISSPLPPPPQQITQCPDYCRLLTVVVHQDFPRSHLGYWSQRGMVIDDMGIMLNFFKGKLLVHDLHTQKWLRDPVHGLHIRSMSAGHKDDLEGHVVEQGNNIFSFVWLDMNIVRCAQFQLTRVDDSFRAHILARSSYEITYGDHFDDCFSMS